MAQVIEQPAIDSFPIILGRAGLGGDLLLRPHEPHFARYVVPLRVAVVLHNLHLPGVLGKSVLAAAMQDFVDSVNPTDGNDWLTLSRAAQTIAADRFEDYVAAAAADGPLLPDTSHR